MIAEMEAVTEDDTAATCAGAASHETEEWHQIDWRHAHRIVRRLQARIVQATQEGRWGKVKALQHLLTHSRSAKVLAVRRVTENQGKHTPGVDRIVWDTPGKKMQAVRALQQRGYQPRPLRRTYVPKSNGKMRCVCQAKREPVCRLKREPRRYSCPHRESRRNRRKKR